MTATWHDEDFLVRLNGAELHFELVGPAGAPLLAYLHGGPGYNAASFRELAGDDLGRFRVLYLDMRGGGRSGPLSETDQEDEVSIDTLVEDLEAVRAFLDGRGLDAETLIPLGHGFGAVVALEYARRVPERTPLVLAVNPWLHYPELALTLLRQAAALSGQPAEDPRGRVEAQTPEGEYPQVGAARAAAAFARLNASDLLAALHFRDAASRMRLEHADAGSGLIAGGELQAALVTRGLWELQYPSYLGDIAVPVAVIAGAHDPTAYPEQSDWLIDLAGADLQLLDTGHYPWLDDPMGFAAAVTGAVQEAGLLRGPGAPRA